MLPDLNSKKIRRPNIIYIHAVQIETSTRWNLIGHCVAELSTGTTSPYIFLVTIYHLRGTQDMCFKLSHLTLSSPLMPYGITGLERIKQALRRRMQLNVM
jgi:hypothetical protein